MNREEVIAKIREHDVLLNGDKDYAGLRHLVSVLMEERAFRKKMLWVCVIGVMSLVGKQIIWPILLTAAKAIH